MWASIKGMKDPCGKDPGWAYVLACYGKYLMNGANCINKEDARAGTIRGYFESVNNLFTARKFPPPVVFNDPSNDAVTVLKNLSAEEDVANRRGPITKAMYTEVVRLGQSEAVGTELWLLAKIASLAKVVGPRASEFAQSTQSRVDVHRYPSGKKVVKAWIRKDWLFYDKAGKKVRTFNKKTRSRIAKVRITWRIQKNRRNGQSITVVRDWDNPEVCPVLAAFDIYMNSIRIGQKDTLPMLAFIGKDGKMKYLTTNKIAEILRKVARTVHADLDEKEIKRFSAHSFRVWACVLLSEAGALPDFICKRLRWESESYKLYLRDTDQINEEHRDKLKQSSAAIMAMLAGNMDTSLVPTEVPEDTDMGEYVDLE